MNTAGLVSLLKLFFLMNCVAGFLLMLVGRWDD
jgi:hypothetical protein